MIHFLIDTNYTYIEKASVKELNFLRDLMTYDDPLYFIKRNFIKGSNYTGKISFVIQNKFPTGMLNDVLYELDYAHIKYTFKKVFYFSKPIGKPEDFLIARKEKREYQLTCVNKCLDRKRGFVSIATAGGKTEIARLIISCIGGKTLFLVEKKELLHQTRTTFSEDMNISLSEIGIVGDGQFILKDITISTVQTLSRLLLKKRSNFFDAPPEKPKSKTEYKRKLLIEWLEDIQILIADECHHVSSDTYFRVCINIKAPYRFALSATPLTGDKLKDARLIAAFGNLLFERTTKDLKGEKYISDADIYFIHIDKVTNKDYGHIVDLMKLYPSVATELDKDDNDSIKKEKLIKYFGIKRKSYQDVYKKGIVRNRYRNEKIIDLMLENKKKKILVLTERREQLYILYKMATKHFSKDKLVRVDGGTPGFKREKIMKGVENGNINYVITTVMKEGANIPNIDIIIIAGGMESKILNKQRIGRGLRLAKGKDKLVVYDFDDNTHPFLKYHSNKRIEILEKDGFKVNIIYPKKKGS